MANVRIDLRIDHPSMQAVVSGLSRSAVQRAAEISRQRYRGNIHGAGRVNTGKMADETRVMDLPSSLPMHPRCAIGTPVPYAKFQEYGTRAHGPVRAKRLKFKPKGSQMFVFATWVRGVTPAKFAQRTLDTVRTIDFEA